jgi:hypothetical protein
MNKFTELISNNGEGTLVKRAKILAESAELAQNSLINKLKSTKAELELELDKLTDLAPETTDSLRPGSKNWNPEQWVKRMQEINEDLYNLEIQILLAEKTYNDYFTEINND